MNQVNPEDECSLQNATGEEDVSRVNEFFNTKTIKEELHRFTYRTTLDRAFERDDRRLFYFEYGSDIIAALMIWCESHVLDPDEAQIRLVAVHPNHRDDGFAQSLCNRAEEFAYEHGEEKISADVAQNSDAVGFWNACGYDIAYEWETENGREMYRVEKALR